MGKEGDPDAIGQVTFAIGETCLWWAYIEDRISDVCLQAAVVAASLQDDKALAVLQVWSANQDMRQRISTAKALLHMCDASLFESAEQILNLIDGDLRSTRNRYIHDQWAFDDGRIAKIQHGSKVRREQARITVLTHETTTAFASVEEVTSFNSRLQEAYDHLGLLIERIGRIPKSL